MNKKKHIKIRHSIFIKILSIVALSIFLIFISIGAFWRSLIDDQSRSQLTMNIAAYFKTITAELDQLRNTQQAYHERLGILKKKYGIEVFYVVAKNKTVSIDAKTKELIDIFNNEKQHEQDHIFRPEEGIELFWHRGGLYAAIETTSGIYYLKSSIAQPPGKKDARFYLVMSVVLLIVILAWLAIRMVLHPIKKIALTLEQVGAGNFDVTLPEKRKDEFGMLSSIINRMVLKIENMLKSRRQLLLDVSHEMRTPITRIKLALAMSSDVTAKESIEEDINELEYMLTEILESARLDNEDKKLELQKILINEVVYQVVEELQAQARVSIEAQNLTLLTEKFKLKTIIKNLLSNALKYSPENKKVFINIYKYQNDTIIEFEDYGPGVEPQNLESIFEPFFMVDKSRTKSGTHGFGLGLHIVKKYTEALSGSIEVESDPGKFTRFKVKLPEEPG